MSTSIETESQKSPEMLEQEINAKRASINNIVDSLESKFTPGQLFDQALAYTKGNGGEFFENLGTTIKNNPLPTALTGLGLAWLAINQNKPFNPGATRTGSGLGDKISEVIGQVTGAVSQAGNKLHGASEAALAKGQDLKGKAANLTQRTGDSIDSTANNVSDGAQQAAHMLGDQAAQLKGQFDTLLKEQPLVLAAVGIALGAAIGAAFPSTSKEDELMGEARDRAFAKARSAGEEVYSTAREAVQESEHEPAEDGEQATLKTAPPPEPATDLSAGLGIRP